ncbi:Mannosyltransferase 1, CMT1 [Kalmanozyma brasiliensis GHG001]|uniref:Mannosyltransferase 1, CMT1 n=1 Tax=Kalmanozyma brasiliensis (strain GHG001) TaxID=1365824 RepID=UPI002867BC89|nr:Mannosyltransferase 1, CMT1 [Kalmanozyma brasiliensis GHG001]EST10220.2 Mannosyltransferase 1, CMT1 [Kalmanozyma brasiliensis GHG001]
MQLCPRAAAQALHSPPELHQREYKDNVAYFDQDDDVPQYALHSSKRFGPDQEPLLESQLPSTEGAQASPSQSPAASCFPRFLARLVSTTLPRSRSAGHTNSASTRPRRAWLPVLLIANLAITVTAFIAACVHYNTFSALFLYLALLIVAFPILSLSLLASNRDSDNYVLRLPDFSPSLGPHRDQSQSSSSSGLFSRSASPPLPTAANVASTRRLRSCRLGHLQSFARAAQYVMAVLWFLAIVEWVFFQPLRPQTNAPTGDEMMSWINASPTAGSAPAQPIRVFIVSNLYNSEEILPTYTSSLKSLINELGADNVFVSIYESHSTDNTKPMLVELDRDLAHMNVSRRVLTDDKAIRKGKHSLVSDRVDFLANVRNTAMQPLADTTEKYTHVLWINDVVFTPQDALNLLRTNNARYDQACAMDFIGNGFYDTWVTRDAEGDTLKRQWPYFKRVEDVQAMREGRPFEVNSCWNGISAFDAKWFYPANSSSLPPAGEGADEDGPVILPLQFRASSTCLSSECQLISYDIHRAVYPARPTILINPAVKVAYNTKHYFMYNKLIPSPILRPWRIIWRDWFAYRLFGWVTEGMRWANECKAKQHYWAAPTPLTAAAA